MKNLFIAAAMALGAAFFVFGTSVDAKAQDIDIEKLKADIALCTQEDGDDAIAGCTDAVQAGYFKAPNGNLGLLYHSRGLLNFGRNYYQAAIDDFSSAIGNVPEMADAYFDRARSYHELGNTISAKADYDKAYQLDPENKTFKKTSKNYP